MAASKSSAKSPPQCHERDQGVRCQLPRGHQSRHANTEGPELVMWRREPDPPRQAEPEPETAGSAGPDPM
jgi:hypothetical protein